VRAVPLTPCRRHGKKRKDEEETTRAQASQNEIPPKSAYHSQSRATPEQVQSSQVLFVYFKILKSQFKKYILL
jgi:hypothetical protein